MLPQLESIASLPPNYACAAVPASPMHYRLHRQVFHNVLIRNLGGPSDNDKLLGKVALDTLNQALKVSVHDCSTANANCACLVL